MATDAICRRCGATYPRWMGSCPVCAPDAMPRSIPPAAKRAVADSRKEDDTVRKVYCPQCGRTYPKTASSCPRCPPAPGAPKGGRCPRCGKSLAVVAMGDAFVDRCEGCGGQWFDRGEIERVLSLEVTGKRPDGAERAAWPKWEASAEEVRYVPCVRCGEKMARRTIAPRAGAIVDLCREHGIWFDAGEFDHFQAFVKAGGLDMVTEDEARRHEERDAALKRAQAPILGDEGTPYVRTGRMFTPASAASLIRMLRSFR